MKKMTDYDQSTYFDEELRKLVSDLTARCSIARIPFYFSFAIANNENDTTYYNGSSLPGSLGVNLSDDKFAEYVLIANGAKAIRPGTLEISDEMIDYINDIDIDE